MTTRYIIEHSGAETESDFVPMNLYQVPANISIGVTVDGTANYTIQHTFDNVYRPPSGGVEVFDHDELVDLADTAQGNYAFPVSGIRVRVNSGTGTVRAVITQGS